ncbi:hypothetical protein BS47DRAFT_1347023 [Hydnum rufescens UP504]|uniref:Uncharacterized protein n=1 Tax=Hydnum rufescens UP504 TaxID=1448309 RepID=A0A9P6DQJ5_9AGAM|nr:hypothetical protein BS47DRAFT_1347023 [Hydnum rufescens UP504]
MAVQPPRVYPQMHPHQREQPQRQQQHQHRQVHGGKRKRHKNSKRERLQPHDLPFARHIELYDEVKSCLVRVSGPCVMFGLAWLNDCFRNEFPILYERVLDCRLHETLGVRVAYLYMKDRAAAHSIRTSGTGPARVVEGPSFADLLSRHARNSPCILDASSMSTGNIFRGSGAMSRLGCTTIVEKRVLHRGQSSSIIVEKPDARLVFPATSPMSDAEEEEEVETMLLYSLALEIDKG